ncbi:hypothetical protein [Arthrobacter sp. G119Y2]|uniref:hypothetical protein n=1 Tax=Arthrobacter sp. G119Y2 TaxID=3134965 RepID=UPI00311A143F
MAGQGGGVASAFGFRYQYLITVEILLDLFASSAASDWVVDVDRAAQDSADIIVRGSVTGPAERAIQVKASLAESSTTIGVTKVREVLAALANEHPTAASREVVTNRTVTAQLKRKLAAENVWLPSAGERFERRAEKLSDLTSALLLRISRLRSSGAGGLGIDLHYLILRQLVDMVHEAGSRPVDQSITREDVRSVLEGPAPVLSDALGARRWGISIQVPRGNYIERPAVTQFLRDVLPGTASFNGSPPVAVIHGMSGTGKTSAASQFARSRLEYVAFILWLDASSPEVLKTQLPAALDELGVRVPMVEPTAEGLMALLGELPVPWLLVLDGVRTIEEIDAWVPRSGYGSTLITTTRADWPQDFAPALRLGEFSRVEAREFVAERLKQPESTWSSEQLAACDEIAGRLSNWPLALELSISWIQRRGSSLDAMGQFAERVERLDLDDAHLLPHGYPRTAAQVIVDLWTELSPTAQRVMSVLLLLGGNRVPERLIADWGLSIDLPVGEALEELFAASVIQRVVATSGAPHDYDETIEVHDFLKLIAQTRGVELDGATVLSLVRTADQSLASLTEADRFREGATLIHPLDHLLRELVETLREEPMVLIQLSVLMHNLAQVAVLTSNVPVARVWYVAAFNVRLADPEHFEGTPEGIQAQLQTLAGAATVMARQHDLAGLQSTAEQARDLVKRMDPTSYDAQTRAAVRSIHENVALRLPASLDQFSALSQLISEDKDASGIPMGSVKVRELQNELEQAVMLVEADQWHLALDRALGAANYALEESLLVDWILDRLLDIGFVLMLAVARRQHELPESLVGCLQRVIAWFHENPAELEQPEKQRLHLLQGLATGKSSDLRTAIASLPRPEERTPMLQAWCELASVVADQLDRFRRREAFANLPEFVTVEIAVDGGDDINYWQEIDPSDGMPLLWVCTASRVRYGSGGKTDPLREEFMAAGLPRSGQGDGMQCAHGWSAILRGNALTINDGDGISRVLADGLETVFCQHIRAVSGLVLVYGDRALFTTSQGPMPSGWVPLAVVFETSPADVPAPTSDGPQPRSQARLRQRMLDWWRRLSGQGFV